VRVRFVAAKSVPSGRRSVAEEIAPSTRRQ